MCDRLTGRYVSNGIDMTRNINYRLYERVKRKGFQPTHVAEVGVWHPDTSNLYQYIQDGVRTTLVEPDPQAAQMIREKFGSRGNVTLHEVALCDFNGEVDLFKRESSTFLSLLKRSPTVINDDFDVQTGETFRVKAKLFSEIDDGTIDLLTVDTEGSEWFVIKNMRSRPVVISIETHGGMYVNPYLEELLGWMRENNYLLWCKEKSDSVFVLQGALAVSLGDRIRLLLSNAGIAFRSRKKKLKKSLSGFHRHRA